MILNTAPIMLQGPWERGYSLDKQVLRSEFIGNNQYGYPMFDTTRTEIGDAMYQLKYQDNYEVLPNIIETASDFLLKSYLIDTKFDDITAVLPSDYLRERQPVFQISNGIAKKINISFSTNYIIKVKKTPQMKDTPIEKREGILLDAFQIKNKEELKKKKAVLIIDDLYQTGTTVKVITNLLKKINRNLVVMILTITKTRNY